MKKRETELDILRLMAMLAVIWVHVGSMETDTLPPSDPNCQWLIFLKSIMTWEIPVYVMISGRFFLDPDRQMPFSKLLKAIGRLALAFAVWNIVYQAYYILTDSYTGLNWKGIASRALIGPYHFWYLYMIAGLYLITPFLRKIAADRKLSEYFIVLFFLFACLSRYPLSGKWEKVLYICAAALLLLGAAANTFFSVQEGAYTERFTGYTAPNTMIVAAGVYTLFTRRIRNIHFSGKVTDWISRLSVGSFGIYLIHALVLEVFQDVGISPTFTHPLLAMPLITLLTLIVTGMLAALIRKIPNVGRKIT